MINAVVQFSAERGREQDHVEPPLGPEMKDRPPLIVLVLHQFCFFRRYKRRPTKDLDPVSPIKKNVGDGGGGWAGDFPARGCQMCDPAHYSVIRVTADSEQEAYGKMEKWKSPEENNCRDMGEKRKRIWAM